MTEHIKVAERLEQAKLEVEAIKYDAASKLRAALCDERDWTCTWSAYSGDWLCFKDGLDIHVKQGGCRESVSPRGVWTAYSRWQSLGFTIEHPLLDDLRDIEKLKMEKTELIEALKPEEKVGWFLHLMRSLRLTKDA